MLFLTLVMYFWHGKLFSPQRGIFEEQNEHHLVGSQSVLPGHLRGCLEGWMGACRIRGAPEVLHTPSTRIDLTNSVQTFWGIDL